MRKLPAPVPCPPRPGGSGGVVVHFVRWLTTGALLAALVAGCGGESSPTPAPPASQSTSASSPTQAAQPAQTAQPTESATPPALPALASKPTKSGARAFVRHYIDLVNYTANSGRTGTLHHLVLAQCGDCLALEEKVTATYSAGGRFITKGWQPRAWFVVLSSPGRAVVDVAIASPRQRWKPSAQARMRLIPSSKFLLEFQLRRLSGRWVVKGLKRK
jgi:uncharacterized protein DUF6318